MMKKYILAIDQSTMSTKSYLINNKGTFLGEYSVEHKVYYPNPGWVEHNPIEIFENTLKTIFELIKKCKVSQKEIAVIALTNQRETTVVWDKTTGLPVCNAIVWQCNRTSEICNSLNAQGFDTVVKSKTGYMIVPSPPGSKLKWIIENIPGAREKMENDQLLFGQMDSWLLWKLTGNKVHATDYSNASRSILFNIDKLEWDNELMAIFGVKSTMLPEVKYSDEVFGYTSTQLNFKCEIPISGIMGNSHAALFGHQCLNAGMAKATYGTVSSIMMNIGDNPVQSDKGLVTSIGWGAKDGIAYVFEGNVNYAGSTIQWLKDDLELITTSQETEGISKSISSTEGVYVIPSFNGMGAPYWDNNARAAILGINRSTKKAHIVRAAVESIAYQVKDILDIMTRQAKVRLKELRVDGGPTKNSFLMQFQADIACVPIAVSEVNNASAFGSALMAGLAVGVWKNKDDFSGLLSYSSFYVGTMNTETVNKHYTGWQNAIKKTLT